jgi:hypothetical protein
MAESSEEKAGRTKLAQQDDAQRRAEGQAFDERMKEFTADAPRPVRSDQAPRRRR